VAVKEDLLARFGVHRRETNADGPSHYSRAR
jgi:hypothetical protein